MDLERKDADVDEAKRLLTLKIEELEGFFQQPHFVSLQNDIEQDIEGCVNRITLNCPETIGQVIAHFADIGRLAGLRTLKSRPEEALDYLKHQLKEL